MGIEWEVLATYGDPPESFMLGKGEWAAHEDPFAREHGFVGLTLERRGREAFVDAVEASWASGRVEPENDLGTFPYIRDMASRLWDFCERHEWRVRLVGDEYEIPHRVVDSRYEDDREELAAGRQPYLWLLEKGERGS